MLNQIIHGDCLDVMGSMEAETVDLTITSPPYNIGKEYETDKLSFSEYISWMDKVIKQVVRVTKKNGSVVFQLGNFVHEGKVIPLDCALFTVFLKYGLIPRNRIIWTFGHGLHCKNRFSGRHETILWFTKSDDYTFNLDPVRVPQKYPNKKSYKGVNKGKLSGNPLGKNPSDVWDISNVKSNHPEKTKHPCQYPIDLVNRLILSLSNPGDVVMDPFVGSGTTPKSAMLKGRNFIAIEKELDYVEISKERII